MKKKMLPFALLALVALPFGCGRNTPSEFGSADLQQRSCKIMIEGDNETVAKERNLITSDKVLKDVLKRLHLLDLWNQESQTPFTEETALKALRDSIKIEMIGGTQIVDISVTRPEGFEAAEIANHIADAYIANRLLLLGKESEGQMLALEDRIAAQKEQASKFKQEMDAFTTSKGTEDQQSWIDRVAESKLALKDAETKLRFVQSVPFEEWPYYTNFDWGNSYEDAIKDLMNANVTLDYLKKTMGGNHPRMAEALKTRDALNNHLLPIVAGIKEQAKSEARAKRLSLEQLQKNSAPPPLSEKQQAEYALIEQKWKQANTEYQAIVEEAKSIGPGATEKNVKVNILEVAKP
jgi:uncharacterized protein involved in exopolysaccharide biosynthesis